MIRLSIVACLIAGGVQADVLVPKRIIAANSIIVADDLQLRVGSSEDGISNVDDVIGKEARVALFAGRPIQPMDLNAPAVVERNQIVQLIFSRNGLVIKTDGRAMGRASPGEVIRVMNLASRSMVSAEIDASGSAHVIR
jgi:flagella basal body P-ring formation protein FlgA